jgi:hypothetical protein
MQHAQGEHGQYSVVAHEHGQYRESAPIVAHEHHSAI